MGATCAKGSKTTDPDKTPYGPAKPGRGAEGGGESERVKEETGSKKRETSSETGRQTDPRTRGDEAKSGGTSKQPPAVRGSDSSRGSSGAPVVPSEASKSRTAEKQPEEGRTSKARVSVGQNLPGPKDPGPKDPGPKDPGPKDPGPKDSSPPPVSVKAQEKLDDKSKETLTSKQSAISVDYQKEKPDVVTSKLTKDAKNQQAVSLSPKLSEQPVGPKYSPTKSPSAEPNQRESIKGENVSQVPGVSPKQVSINLTAPSKFEYPETAHSTTTPSAKLEARIEPVIKTMNGERHYSENSPTSGGSWVSESPTTKYKQREPSQSSVTRSPANKRSPLVDMNVEPNMAIFDALKAMKTTQEKPAPDVSSEKKELTSPRIVTSSDDVMSPAKESSADKNSRQNSQRTSSDEKQLDVTAEPATKAPASPASSNESNVTGDLKTATPSTVPVSVSSVKSHKSDTSDVSADAVIVAKSNQAAEMKKSDNATVSSPSVSARPVSATLPSASLISGQETGAPETKASVTLPDNKLVIHPTDKVSHASSVAAEGVVGKSDKSGETSAAPSHIDKSPAAQATTNGARNSTSTAQREEKRDAGLAISTSETSSLRKEEESGDMSKVEPKSKPVSKLPTSRLPSSSALPPTSTSSTSSKTDSPASPISPSSALSSPLSPAPNKTIPYGKKEKIVDYSNLTMTRSLLLDLSSENKAIMEFNKCYANTRTKLMQAVDKWFARKEKENASRVLAIHGAPGIGKTCFSAEVCRNFANDLIGCHFFEYLPIRPDHNCVLTMLLSLAWQLSEAFPDYLKEIAQRDKLQEIINDGSIAELFDMLITKPLQSSNIDQARSGAHKLLVIDALDECSHAQKTSLLQLVNDFDQAFPDWLFLLVTLSDDNQSVSQLSSVQLIEVKGTSETMNSDLKRFFKDPMSPFIDRISLDGAQAQLMQNSQGSFLAAYLLKRHLDGLPAGTKLALRDVSLFPSGLASLCKDSFQKLYDYICRILSVKEADKVYKSYVGLLAVIEEPIDLAAFQQLCPHINADEALSMLGGCVCTRPAMGCRDSLGCRDNRVSLYHRNILDWLHSTESTALKCDIPEAQKKMADLVLCWLSGTLGETSRDQVHPNLKTYALKHCLTHFTDAAKQQDNITRVLCSLNYIQDKLQLPGMSLRLLLNDFKHSHYQNVGSKSVTLEAYMKKFPDLATQIQLMQKFVEEKGTELERRPEYTLHIASNYPNVSRIQQNAKMDLADKPWLEDITTVSDSSSVIKRFQGPILDIDISPDNKSIVLLTGKENRVMLQVLNAASIDSSVNSIDLHAISDHRSGSSVNVLPDNTNVFVGSLSTYINLKTGKPVETGFNIANIPIKERFSIECCDSSSNLLCCGVTTLPFGGRSIDILVFDLKAKKFVTSLEVLKFKFGGNPLFGVRDCSLSSDGTVLCACVKTTNKSELKATTWSTATWEVMQSVVIDSDALTKCSFVDNQNVFLGCSSHYSGNASACAARTLHWSVQTKSSPPVALSRLERASVFHTGATRVTLVQWFHASSQAVVSRWKKWSTTQLPDEQFLVRGITESSDVVALDKSLIFITGSCIKAYQISDLEKIENFSTTTSFPVHSALVQNNCSIPRSDEFISTYSSPHLSDGTFSLCTINVKSDNLTIAKRLITDEKSSAQESGATHSLYFPNPCSRSPGGQVTADGTHAVYSNGSNVTLLDLSSGSKQLLQVPSELPATNERNNIAYTVSSKDSLVGVVYSSAPAFIYVYDTKSKPGSKPLAIIIDVNSSESRIDEFQFLPSNGNLITYCKNNHNSVTIYNQRTGAVVNQQLDVNLTYAAFSYSSDRLALSLSRDVTNDVILRSADNSFTKILKFAPDTTWLAEREKSDLEFATDGTVLVGVCSEGRVARIWNAGNGEVLIDLHVTMTGDTMVAGMLTNNHVLLCDSSSWLSVCEIDSGKIIAALPCQGRLRKRCEQGGWRVLPKGNVVVGSTEGGEMMVVRYHNVAPVKLKTTLQLLKTTKHDKVQSPS